MGTQGEAPKGPLPDGWRNLGNPPLPPWRPQSTRTRLSQDPASCMTSHGGPTGLWVLSRRVRSRISLMDPWLSFLSQPFIYESEPMAP